jgi:DNA polymerase III delta prime subunit
MTEKNNRRRTLRKNSESKKLNPIFLQVYSELIQYTAQWFGPKLFPKLEELLKLIGKNKPQTAVMVIVFKYTSQKHIIDIKSLTKLISDILSISESESRREIRTLISHSILEYETKENQKSLQLSEDTLEAIDHGYLEYFQKIDSKGIEKVLEQIHTHIFEPYWISSYKLEEVYEQILENNPELSLVKYIEDEMLFVNSVELLTFFGIITEAISSKKAYDFETTEEKLKGNLIAKTALKNSIQEKEWSPIKQGLVEIDGGGMLDGKPKLRLTQNGFDKFFGEVDPKILKWFQTHKINLSLPIIAPHEIKQVNLLFSNRLEQQLKKIKFLLSDLQFEQFKENQKNRTTGITALFFGAPGCGKTEFALQMAKESNRHLIKIQISDILSKWVGESEKNLMKVFEDYHLACQKFERTPILFLNEADQLISNRLTATNGVEQMHNGMQNLLLEALENFQGILIGTTNREMHMDKAFERRWLFKINFDKPNEPIQLELWKNLLPELNEQIIKDIIANFNFTPAEIQNIARRFEIEFIMGLNQLDVPAKIIELCQTERLNQTQSETSIGFQLNSMNFKFQTS